MPLNALTTFSPLRIRSAETPPKTERTLTPGREMTREERKMARRRDVGGMDTYTAYTGKRTTFKLPSAHLQTNQSNNLPSAADSLFLQPNVPSLGSETVAQVDENLIASSQLGAKKIQISLTSSAQDWEGVVAGPLAVIAPGSHLDSSTKSKGRLSSEALARGWGIVEPDLPPNIHRTRKAVRSTSNADTSQSSQNAGNQSRTLSAKKIPRTSQFLDHDEQADFGRKQLDGADLERLGALPKPPSPPPDPSEYSHSTGKIVIRPPNELTKMVGGSLPDASTMSHNLSGISAPQSQAESEPSGYMSSYSLDMQNRHHGSIDVIIDGDTQVSRKKRRITPPPKSNAPHHEPTTGSTSSSSHTLRPPPVAEEPKPNVGLEPEPVQPSGPHQPKLLNGRLKRAPVSLRRQATMTQKPSKELKNSAQARQQHAKLAKSPSSSKDVATSASISISTPVSYAKALTRSLNKGNARFNSPLVAAVPDRPSSTHLADITNTPRFAQPTESLSMARPRKTVQDSTTPFRLMTKVNIRAHSELRNLPSSTVGHVATKEHRRLEQAVQPSKWSEGHLANQSGRQSVHLTQSPTPTRSPTPSRIAQPSLRDGISNQSQSGDGSPSVIPSADVKILRDEQSMDTTRTWSPLKAEVIQPKKVKKLAHQIFTPAKVSGSSGLSTGHASAMQPPEVQPYAGHSISGQRSVNTTRGSSNKDELYVVADRFIDDDEFEEWEADLTAEHAGLLTKIKNQLNPPDIVSISIRKLLLDEIEGLEAEDGASAKEKQKIEKQKQRLQDVHDQFKLEMMEYSRQLIRHGLLKLKLQMLIESDRKATFKPVDTKSEASQAPAWKDRPSSSAPTRDFSDLEGGATEPATKKSKSKKMTGVDSDHLHLHVGKPSAGGQEIQFNQKTVEQTKSKRPAKKPGRSARKAKRR